MSKIRSVVIMAGGSGERFYPASRLRKPKQLLRLVADNKTMIEEAVERIVPLIPVEHIFIITSELLQNPIRDALPQLPPENIIAEPAKKIQHLVWLSFVSILQNIMHLRDIHRKTSPLPYLLLTILCDPPRRFVQL